MMAEQLALPLDDDYLEEEWWSTEEVAALVGVDPSTIRRWRTARPAQGPPFVRLSSRVTKYVPADVRLWMRRHRTDPEQAA